MDNIHHSLWYNHRPVTLTQAPPLLIHIISYIQSQGVNLARRGFPIPVPPGANLSPAMAALKAYMYLTAADTSGGGENLAYAPYAIASPHMKCIGIRDVSGFLVRTTEGIECSMFSGGKRGDITRADAPCLAANLVALAECLNPQHWRAFVGCHRTPRDESLKCCARMCGRRDVTPIQSLCEICVLGGVDRKDYAKPDTWRCPSSQCAAVLE